MEETPRGLREWVAGEEKGMKETLKDETNVRGLCMSRHLNFLLFIL